MQQIRSILNTSSLPEFDPHCIAAIDPGRAKCGIAVVSLAGAVLYRTICSPDSLCTQLTAIGAQFKLDRILIGDGTSSRDVDAIVKQSLPDLPVDKVMESHTSERARERWRQTVEPKGFQKFLPRSLRTPDAPYDDLVAVILAEDWLSR